MEIFGGENSNLCVVLPFHLKVTHYEEEEILSPQPIEASVSIRFTVMPSGSKFYVAKADLVKWIGKKYAMFPHYHMMNPAVTGREEITCWGSYEVGRYIQDFKELILMRDQCEAVLHNIGHEMNGRTLFTSLPDPETFKLGKKRVITTKTKAPVDLKLEVKV